MPSVSRGLRALTEPPGWGVSVSRSGEFQMSASGLLPVCQSALLTGTGALYDRPTSTARLPSAPVEGGMTQGGERTERRFGGSAAESVSYTHLRAHETDSYL